MPGLLAVGLASRGAPAREQQVWGTGSGAEHADLPKSVERLVGFVKTGQTNETVGSLQSTLPG